MSEFVKGYQYSPVDGRFIGEYDFPNNLDREEIHVPPFTTLQAPPVGDSNDIAFWRGDAWELVIVPNEPYTPPIEDYLMITESFIQYLKDADRWTADDQAKRDQALAEAEANKPSEVRADAA